MQVVRTRCDNPLCKTIGEPESGNPYVGPYGWVRLDVVIIGTGPNVSVEVCSSGCITKAVENEFRKASERQ